MNIGQIKRQSEIAGVGGIGSRIQEVRPAPVVNQEVLSSTERIRQRTTKLKDICIKFFRTSSLHALKFIADNEITSGGKYFFSVAFLLAVVTSAYYITAIYYNWMESPIITTTSSIPSSISTIPFPAITICNLNQARKSVVDGFKENSLDYWRLKNLCKPNVTGIPEEILEESAKGIEYRHFILNVSQKCDKMLLSCKFGSETMSCESIFQPVLTDEGLCCTFNAVDRKFMFLRGSDEITKSNWTAQGEAVDWTAETGYGTNVMKNIFPRPALGTGVHMGLTVVLNASLDEYYCSSASSAGFKMMMHSPTETPKVANYGYLISAGEESRITVNPEVHKAVPAIRSMNIKYRNCLFASESKLEFYRIYSKSNCELECELLRVLAACDCVPFYLPRTSDDVNVCGLKELNCTRQIQRASDSLMTGDVKCSRCPQACSSINYFPIVTTNPLILANSYLKDDFMINSESDFENLAVVHFYYEYNSFRSKTKEELLNFTDFLANSGGILGLFMGFSLLAVIEFLYFVFMAPYSAINKLLLYRRGMNRAQTVCIFYILSRFASIIFPQNQEEVDPKEPRYRSDFAYTNQHVIVSRKNFRSRYQYSFYQ